MISLPSQLRPRHAGMAALALCTFLLGVALSASAADKGPRLSPAVYKPLSEANKLIQATKYEEAKPLLDQARAAAKTDFDRLQTSELTTQVEIKLQNYLGAADSIEAALVGNLYPPDVRKDRLGTVCKLRYQTKQIDAVIAACNRALTENGPSYDLLNILAQTQYTQKKWPEASVAIQSALKIGGDRDVSLLEMAFNTYFNLKDKVGQRDTLRHLVTLNPSKEYWARVVDLAEQSAPKKPRLDLDFDRIRFAAGLLEEPRQYTEMAQIASEAGAFAESQKILQKGINERVLGQGADKARTNALLAKAKALVAEDMKGLPKFATEAKASKDGRKDLVLGQAYVDYDRYDDGIAAIKRALSKGIDPAEGNLRLGQGLLAAGKRDEALVAFNAVAAGPYKDIADIWIIYMKSTEKK